MDKELQGQRTYILLGSSGAGKTSLAEMVLFASGASTRMGTIEGGNTFMDFEPEEVKKGGSIQPAYAVYNHDGQQHFVIDVPGDTNFQGELPYQLAAADGAVYVFDAVSGIKPQDRKIWRDYAMSAGCSRSSRNPRHHAAGRTSGRICQPIARFSTYHPA